ncbi:hypothetical protein KC726_02720 [Candidatus Woesebacteria bacterium]|nr:hypothetical protein [Candidatus Woesebacteria bacterium]
MDSQPILDRLINLPLKHFLLKEGKKLAHELPLATEWLECITGDEQVRQMIRFYENAEAAGIDLFSKAKKMHLVRANRTDSNPSYLFQRAFDVNGRIDRVPIRTDSFSNTGSSGSKVRQYVLRAAINELGIDVAFQRLPPIIVGTNLTLDEFLSINAFSYETSKVRLFDGATRLMLAHENGLETIPGYVLSGVMEY